MMAEYNSKDYQIQYYDKRKWDEYEKVELAWFAQDARQDYMNICDRLGFNKSVDLDALTKKIQELNLEAARAQTILDDWQKLKEHMEKNPTIKEEWEGILMAIRLTEED